MEHAPVSLFELNGLVKTLIKNNLHSYWLTAEISELTVNYSGHCYLEFVQKDEKNDRIIARARATIWANTFRMIKPYFETTTARQFSSGIKVMVRVTVEFHEVYGLSLNVLDIEPTYTVGEIAIRRQKIIEKLRSEGVLEMNQGLDIAYIPNRIAVISSKTAAGYEDFFDQLTNNPNKFKFYLKLFPAIMQGNEAENSIIRQLDIIFGNVEKFDAVVIIRGGGAQADLECFNSYWLAYNIAQFPLPVLTGIGHEQDDSVVDMVAHTRLKTPTAVAEYLIDCMSVAESDLFMVEEQIADIARELVLSEKSSLKEHAYLLNKAVNVVIARENRRLSGVHSNCIAVAKSKISALKIKLSRSQVYLGEKSKIFILAMNGKILLEKNMLRSSVKALFAGLKYELGALARESDLNNPMHILKKGYSVTTLNGKAISDSSVLSAGDKIETLFYKGKTISKIE
ncbi:MAG: exodeoxyribonuclease VII large subunit [Bacteroidales bacterium]|nr:exodeoxyribonuclease VII large subunit [Bacteroidales bacterium]